MKMNSSGRLGIARMQCVWRGWDGKNAMCVEGFGQQECNNYVWRGWDSKNAIIMCGGVGTARMQYV